MDNLRMEEYYASVPNKWIEFFELLNFRKRELNEKERKEYSHLEFNKDETLMYRKAKNFFKHHKPRCELPKDLPQSRRRN